MRKLVAEQMEGEGGNKWAEIAKSLPGRNGKQCRERCEHSLPRRRRVPHPVHPNPIPVTSYPCHIPPHSAQSFRSKLAQPARPGHKEGRMEHRGGQHAHPEAGAVLVVSPAVPLMPP